MGFEVVVRPVVFPNIRPAPAQSQPAADDPTQGLATIHAASGKFVDLQYSWSASGSQSKPQETQRREDLVRVYQKETDGTLNKDNYVDIRVANKIWLNDGGIETQYSYTKMDDNAENGIEVRQRNMIRKNPNT